MAIKYPPAYICISKQYLGLLTLRGSRFMCVAPRQRVLDPPLLKGEKCCGGPKANRNSVFVICNQDGTAKLKILCIFHKKGGIGKIPLVGRFMAVQAEFRTRHITTVACRCVNPFGQPARLLHNRSVLPLRNSSVTVGQGRHFCFSQGRQTLALLDEMTFFLSKVRRDIRNKVGGVFPSNYVPTVTGVDMGGKAAKVF